MKIIFKLLICIVSMFAYSQEYTCDVDSNILDLHEFVNLNLDSIQKYSKVKIIKAIIEFDAEGGNTIESVSYLGFSDLKINESSLPLEVKIWRKLDLYIRQQYRFCPNLNMDNEDSHFSNIEFYFTIDKNELPKAIAGIKENIKGVKEHYRNELKEIKKDSHFSLKTNNVFINKEFKGLSFDSQLDFYNSKIIEIAPSYYLLFKVTITSENGELHQYLDYKLYRAELNFSKLIYKESAYIDKGNSVKLEYGMRNKDSNVRFQIEINFE